jgi:hypothetical protein
MLVSVQFTNILFFLFYDGQRLHYIASKAMTVELETISKP